MKYVPKAIILVLLFSVGVFAQKVDSIRAIDFSNFTYPAYQQFTLKNGKFGVMEDGMTLWKVVYGDVTGDGVEEAIVILNMDLAGSALMHRVYIYTLKNRLPKLILAFTSGDRAWGGLRKIYAKNGGLLVELFGKGTRFNKDLIGTDDTGLCCPKSFTRTFYQWHRGRFRQKGEVRVLPNPMVGTRCPTCLPDSEKDDSQ